MSKITKTNEAAAGVPTPASGKTTLFVDTDKKLKTKDDSGTVTDYSAAGNSITQLTGEVVAGPGPGSVVATLSNAAVISKVLTGFAEASGAVTASDSILSAIGKLASRNDIGDLGDGSDGIVTITTDTTLVRDMYYDTLTINPTINLYPNGFRIFCLNTLTCNGIINRNGNNAVGNTAGAIQPAGTLGSGSAGGVGGGAGAGTAGTAAANSLGGSAGSGGAGAAGGGGAAGTNSPPSAATGGQEVFKTARQALAGQIAGATPTLALGGSGGGGGGGGGVAASGGGGGGGGGPMLVVARTLTGTGSLSAHGGDGGNAPGVNGGGGGAGGGGVIVTISQNDVTATSLTFDVAPGAVGSGNGTGVGGNPGGAGRTFKLRT